MPRKKPGLTQKQQAEQFKEAIRAMVAAGELNPTEADANFERLMNSVAIRHQTWIEGEEDSESPI